MLKYDEILNGVCDELNLWKNQRDEGGRPYGEAEKERETKSFPYDLKALKMWFQTESLPI